VILPDVGGPEVENAVVGVAAVSEVAKPEVVFVVDLEVSEPGVASVVAASIVDAAGLLVSVGILVAFAVFAVAFVVVVEVGNCGHPRFPVFANIYPSAILSIAGEDCG